jgi:hypothetical protein
MESRIYTYPNSKEYFTILWLESDSSGNTWYKIKELNSNNTYNYPKLYFDQRFKEITCKKTINSVNILYGKV